MIRFLLIVAALTVLIIVGVVVALARPMPMIPYTQPAGPMTGLGGPMIPGKIGSGGPPPVTNDLLLVNGSSYLLLVDGTSKLCLAGGC